MNARVTLYKFKPGNTDTAIRKAEMALLPIFQKQPGFRSYQVVRTGTESVISISMWDTESHAQSAVKIAKAWVGENLSDELAAAETHTGPVVFSHGK